MPATLEEKIKFRDSLFSTFRQIQNEFNISPKIQITQSAHESNWGLSQLSVEGFNIYGMTPGEAWVRAKNGLIQMDTVPNWSALGKETVYFPTTEHSDYPPNKIRYWEFPDDVVSKEPDGTATDEVDSDGKLVHPGGSLLTINRYFRKYGSWSESAWDFARKIATDLRYRFAYDASKLGDVVTYGYEISKAGYATDPHYQACLMATAHDVDLLPVYVQ